LTRIYLHVTRPAVEVEVKVFDLAIIRKLVCNILLGGFFMNIGNKNNPSFDSCDEDLMRLVREVLSRLQTHTVPLAYLHLSHGKAQPDHMSVPLRYLHHYLLRRRLLCRTRNRVTYLPVF